MELVYHYTTIEKFQEILKSSIGTDGKISEFKFWASSIYAMNDPMEFRYGYNILWKEIIPDIEREIGIKNDIYKISKLNDLYVQKPEEEFSRMIIHRLYDSHETPFIISFSKRKDFLPMWTTYAQDGTGICLGFNNYDVKIEKLDAESDVDIIYNLHAPDVSYKRNDEEIKNLILKLYRKKYTELKNNSDERKIKDSLTKELGLYAIVASPYFKHSAYEYEQETRLIQFKKDEKDVKFRCNARGRLIPYIEVPVEASFLQKIIVGPCADFESIGRELRNMLSQYGINLQQDSITKSKVPYRQY